MQTFSDKLLFLIFDNISEVEVEDPLKMHQQNFVHGQTQAADIMNIDQKIFDLVEQVKMLFYASKNDIFR